MTKAKLNKTATKRTAPVPPILAALPSRPSESERMLQMLCRELRSARVNSDVGYNGPANASMEAAMDFAKAMAHLPPETPTEVMAQACILFDEARDVALAGEWSDGYAKGVSERMVRRALGIAMWLETAFQVDRRETALDVLMPENRHEIAPMAAPSPSYCQIEWAIRRRYEQMGFKFSLVSA
jgi:hypothetical protein